MSFVAKQAKDPGSKRPLRFDWFDWLEGEGVSIESYTLATTGVSVVADSHENGVITAIIEGGTVGEMATVRCRIVTTPVNGEPLRDEETVYIRIEEN